MSHNALIGWYPGHMVKAQRQIKEKLSLVDGIVELIDARAPLSSRNSFFDTLGKSRFFLVTKVSMTEETCLEKHLEAMKVAGDEVFCCDLKDEKSTAPLIKALQSRLRERGVSRFMVVGVPNVGKSTFINRCVGGRSAKVGDRVGITRQLQWYKLKGGEIELLDTPGISMPHFHRPETALHLALIGSLKMEVLPLDVMTQYLVEFMGTHYRGFLESHYKLENTLETGGRSYVETLGDVGRRRGKIRGGEVDYEQVYELILNDFRQGKLGKICLDRLP